MKILLIAALIASCSWGGYELWHHHHHRHTIVIQKPSKGPHWKKPEAGCSEAKWNRGE